MGKNGYLQRQRNTVNVYRQAEKETYIQFMTDTLILTLNDPAVMGKDVFGEKRIRRVVEAWGKVTSIAKGAKHPYHLVNQGGGCTVYGWVNAADIGADSGAEQAVYTVVAGDSLWGIAQKRLGNGNRYKEIMTLNGLSSTVIRPGQKLKLPS